MLTRAHRTPAQRPWRGRAHAPQGRAEEAHLRPGPGSSMQDPKRPVGCFRRKVRFGIPPVIVATRLENRFGFSSPSTKIGILHVEYEARSTRNFQKASVMKVCMESCCTLLYAGARSIQHKHPKLQIDGLQKAAFCQWLIAACIINQNLLCASGSPWCTSGSPSYALLKTRN